MIMLGDTYLNKSLVKKLFLQAIFKLLIILLVVKLYAQNDIFKYVKKKHGQDTITVIWSLEKFQTKFMKVSAGIRYIKTCKKEQLMPTFARVKAFLLALSSERKLLALSWKLRWKINIWKNGNWGKKLEKNRQHWGKVWI